MIKKLKLSTLITDAGTDVRSEINEDIVTQYGLAAHAKEKFPPLIIFDTKEGQLVADGFHRFFGFERQGIKEYDCDIRKGTREDAIKFALGCNTTHGLRRTNADKRHAVEIGLKEFPKLSDRALADICSVSNTYVGEIRKGIEDQQALDEPNPASTTPPPRPARTGKDGKDYSVPARPKSPTPARPEPKPTSTLDATGIAVPDEIIPYWDSTFAEAQRLMTMISEIRSRINKATETNEPAFREVDKADVNAKLEQVYVDLKRAKPYAVCRECNGIETKDCGKCHGRGFVSQFFWDHCMDDETKKISTRK